MVLADFDEPKDDGSAAGFDGAAKVCDLLRDVAGRVGLLELPDLWSSALFGMDASDWLESGRAAGVTDDDLRERLVEAVRGARLPAAMVYAGVVQRGGRGGLVLDEDMLAQRLVADEMLLFSAASFWRYDGNGLWQREVTTLRIEKKIREAMRAAGGGELITKARVASVLGLAKSVRHCEVERMNAQPRGMVCVENGMLDTRDGSLHPHRMDYLMNTRIPHRWLPGATCPNWLDWLLERHPEFQRLQRHLHRVRSLHPLPLSLRQILPRRKLHAVILTGILPALILLIRLILLPSNISHGPLSA